MPNTKNIADVSDRVTRLDVQDSGKFKCFAMDAGDLWVQVGSYDDTKEHRVIESLRGKTVRIRVDVED